MYLVLVRQYSFFYSLLLIVLYLIFRYVFPLPCSSKDHSECIRQTINGCKFPATHKALAKNYNTLQVVLGQGCQNYIKVALC